MKSKIAMTLILLSISLTMCIGLASAQDEIKIYAYTDKPYYEYGDEGTLYVTIQNRGSAVDLNYIKVEFPWQNGQFWNFTYFEIPSPKALGGGDNRTYQIAFKVPFESRSGWKDNDARVILYHSGAESPTSVEVKINLATLVYNETILPIYYLLGVLTTAVIVVIIELYFVWKRLGRRTAVSAAP